MYGRREPPQEPPCHQCRVDLSAENDTAAAVYMMARLQVVTMGLNGKIVDISIPAVKIAMDFTASRIKWPV